MSKFTCLFVLLVVLWVVLPAECEPTEVTEVTEDNKDVNKTLEDSEDCVEAFVKKLKAARRLNATFFNSEKFRDLPWYKQLWMWLENESDDFVEQFHIYYAIDPEYNATKGGCPLKKPGQIINDTRTMANLLVAYLVSTLFVHCIALMIGYRLLTKTIPMLRRLRAIDVERAEPRATARGRRKPARRAPPAGGSRREKPNGWTSIFFG